MPRSFVPAPEGAAPPAAKKRAPRRKIAATAPAQPGKRAEEVLESLRQQQADQPKNSELVINLAESALRCGHHEEAITAYERAIELDPRVDLRITYYQWLGYFREAREEQAEALDAYEKWSTLDPQSLEAYDRQASLLVRLQRWTDFALLQLHYARLGETGVRGGKEAHALYCHVLQQVGFADEQNPLEQTYAALEFSPQSISLRYLLGLVLSGSSQLEAAEREFRRVLELDTRSDWQETRYGLDWDAQSTHLMLARLARLRGHSEEALQLLQGAGRRAGREGVDEMAALLLENARYRELLELLPPGEELPDWLQRAQAVALLGLGQIEDARAVLVGKPAAATHPAGRSETRPVPQWKQHLEAGEFEKTLEALKGRRLTPETLEGRCQALYSLERHAECDQALRKLLDRQPDAIEAWKLLAAVSQQLGHLHEAQLAQIQAESLKQRHRPDYASGFVWPVTADGILGFRFIASTRPGKAGLRLTGQPAKRFEDLAWYALNLLQPRCEPFGLEDPAYREVHLHVSAVGRIPRDAKIPDGDNDEEAGAAIFSALAAGLAGPRLPTVRWAVYGRLELDGRLMGPVELAESLQLLGRSQFPWEQLLLPVTAAPQLMEVRPDFWLGSQLSLCSSLEQLLDAVVALRTAPQGSSPGGPLQ